MKKSVPEILALKGKEKISVVTAYDYATASIIDGEVDIFLVGDSLGMVVYGMDSTLPVTVEMMINHGKAVVRGAKQTLVVVDMPFGSYQESTAQAFRNSAKIMEETGCHAVKLEGGVEMAETIGFLVERGIPVMAHIGLQPQSYNVYGGFKVQGRELSASKKIIADAKAVAKAGAFSVVIEGVTEKLAADITNQITIPTIGIGASPKCDGQVLVINDLLGMTATPPKFVKKYADMAGEIKKAVKKYSADVKSGKFPGKDNCYK